MKTAMLTSAETAPAILVHAGAASATSIGLVQGEPQSLSAFQASLEHMPTMAFAGSASGAAMIMAITAGLVVLTSRLNRRLSAMLILACTGFYAIAALYAIQAVAAMRQ
jgi:hypothetical protein